MTGHAKDALPCLSVSEVFNLAFAVSTSEATATERLIFCKNSKVFNLVPTG
jgi:hypothetical protein